MSVMFILIGCSFLLAIGFLGAFIWSVRSGQMDDDYTPSVRILFDDIKPKTETTNTDAAVCTYGQSTNNLSTNNKSTTDTN